MTRTVSKTYSEVGNWEGINRERLWDLVEYEPHEAQGVYHASRARNKVAACGRRFGKSRMSVMDKLEKLFIPKLRWWFIADTYFTGEEEFNYLEDALATILRRFGVKLWTGLAHNVRTGELYIKTIFKSEAWVRSAQHPKSLVGKGLGQATMCEAAKLDPMIWEKNIQPALTDWNGTADFTSTPEGNNYFKGLYDKGQDPEHRLENGAPWEDSWESWNFPSWCNTKVFPGGFEDPKIKAMKGSPGGTPIFWQESGADFTSLVGLIYPMFSREKHVIDHKYLPNVPNYVFIDSGYTNPFVCLDVQITADEKVYVWREHYTRHTQTYEDVRQMKARPQPEGYHIIAGFGDCAAPSDIEELSRTFASVTALPEAKQDFTTAVGLIQRFLIDESGQPRLFVDRSCVHFIDEIENYTWKNVSPDEDETINEKPRTKKDHCMDALRYGMMHLFWIGARYHLSDVMPAITTSRQIDWEPEEYSRRYDDDPESTIFGMSSMRRF